MTFDEWWVLNFNRPVNLVGDDECLTAFEAWTAAKQNERERAAKIAAEATIGLTGFVESDRMEFCVKNLAKLREKIAAAIIEGAK